MTHRLISSRCAIPRLIASTNTEGVAYCGAIMVSKLAGRLRASLTRRGDMRKTREIRVDDTLDEHCMMGQRYPITSIRISEWISTLRNRVVRFCRRKLLFMLCSDDPSCL